MKIIISADGRKLCTSTGGQPLTSGSVGIEAAFVLSADYDGLAVTAVFRAGDVSVDVLLTGPSCTVPWEVLETSGHVLIVGVVGKNGSGEIVVPTIWGRVGMVECGTVAEGIDPQDPTPDIAAQLLQIAQETVERAETAETTATEAAEAAGESATAAGEAKTDAETAAQDAEAAQAAAEVAQGKAEDAQAAAEVAQGKAEVAQGKAEEAQGAAETAQAAAEVAQGKAEDAQGAAETAKDSAASFATGAAGSATTAAQQAQAAAAARAAAEAAQEAAEEAKTYAQTFTGAPRATGSASQMTDTSLIYVYTGATSVTLTNGHWYYWDGNTWADGGVYNSTALQTDTTLTVSGAAADAKATGDAVNDLKSAFADINNVVEVNDFENFNVGGLTFNNETGGISKVNSNNNKFLLLYNVDYLRIDKTGYGVYLKKISTEDGSFSDTIKLETDINEYEFSGKSHFAIIIDTQFSGSVFNLKYHTYSTSSKGEYTRKEFFNISLKAVWDFTGNYDYFDFASATRCCTKRIHSNRIQVKCAESYQALVYKMENDDWSIVGSWNSNATIYSPDTEYFVILVRKSNNDNISPEEALNNTDISVSPFSDSPEVIYFTTSVPIKGNVYTDHAILVLPRNYSPDGEPVRLCIVCHGGGASKYEKSFTQMDATGKILGEPQRVLTKKGYAVLDCYAAPYDYVGNTSDTLGLHYGNPSVVTCYQKAYEYAIKNFNVKNDGILLFASSMGGLSLSQIVNNSSIPILCAVGYCPCLDMFKQAWSNTWAADQRSNIARLFEFEGTAPAYTNGWNNLTLAEKEYFYSNIDKVLGLYPILYNATTGSFDEIKSYMPASASGEDATERGVYNSFRAFYKVPLLIVHCENDTTMACRYSTYFIGMLKRNGARCKIKTYATGGHAAWAAGEDVNTTDISGDTFTCKDSQMVGYNFALQFDR